MQLSRSDLEPAAPQLNLRELQAEALRTLYVGTALLGLALIYLTYSWPDLWPAALIGIAFILAPYPLHRLGAARYPARVWLLAGLWAAGALAAAGRWPGAVAESLLALPVALLALLVGPRAGLAAAAGFTLAVVAAQQAGAAAAADWGDGVVLAWALALLIWAVMRPIEAALDWSWTRYAMARRELDAARDAQADLKQAVKDLAEANLQTARLNQLLGYPLNNSG